MPSSLKNNIGLLMELMDGEADVAKGVALSLWQSFFFCIPVVSTSLASVSRLFGSLGKENIGWLLLDEAGQATPQSAAGIIYRTKRSIIIGDPLQIEPVVTVPGKLINVLNRQYKTDPLWSPLISSAQNLADSITTSGTWKNRQIMKKIYGRKFLYVLTDAVIIPCLIYLMRLPIIFKW